MNQWARTRKVERIKKRRNGFAKSLDETAKPTGTPIRTHRSAAIKLCKKKMACKPAGAMMVTGRWQYMQKGPRT
ncbi:hypothetical protein [Citromicrobium bathyomarinum]|uniref:hypothetical protein n=1 Tax=Citromicrobium bathyomarinum TaxID=72174 RepID=UPI00315A9D87